MNQKFVLFKEQQETWIKEKKEEMLKVLKKHFEEEFGDANGDM